jgi:hypothetical protein
MLVQQIKQSKQFLGHGQTDMVDGKQFFSDHDHHTSRRLRLISSQHEYFSNKKMLLFAPCIISASKNASFCFIHLFLLQKMLLFARCFFFACKNASFCFMLKNICFFLLQDNFLLQNISTVIRTSSWPYHICLHSASYFFRNMSLSSGLVDEYCRRFGHSSSFKPLEAFTGPSGTEPAWWLRVQYRSLVMLDGRTWYTVVPGTWYASFKYLGGTPGTSR